MLFRSKSRHRTFTITIAATLAILANVVGFAPANASTDWTPGEEVLGAAAEVGAPVLAVSENGTTAVAAWSRGNSSGSVIELSVGRITSNGVDWELPNAVSETVPSQVPGGAADPQVSLSENGEQVLVLWRQKKSGTFYDEIFARVGVIVTASIQWGDIVQVSDEDVDGDGSPEHADIGLEGVINAAGTSAVVSWYGFEDLSNSRYKVKTRALSISGTTLTPDPAGSVMHNPGVNSYVSPQQWDLTVSRDGKTAAITWLEQTAFTSQTQWPLKVQSLSMNEGVITASSTVQTIATFPNWYDDSALSADGTKFMAFWSTQNGVFSWSASISGANITPDGSITQLSQSLTDEGVPTSAKLALSHDGQVAALAWARENGPLRLFRTRVQFFTLANGNPASLGDEIIISDLAKQSLPLTIQFSAEGDGLVTLETYDKDWNAGAFEAATFQSPTGSTSGTSSLAVIADSSTATRDYAQAISRDGSRKMVLWRSTISATNRLLYSLLVTPQVDPESEASSLPPRWVDPVLPIGPVTLSGSIVPGGVVSCAAPVFDPVATSLDYVWLIDGVEAGRSTTRDTGTASLTLPSSTKIGAVVGCRVTALTSIGSGTVTAELTVKPAPPVVTPTAPTSPVTTCKLGSTSSGIAASFAAGSAKLSAAAIRSLRSAAGTACTGTVMVTGYVQSTKSTANDLRLARARAQAVVNTLKAQHPDVTFQVLAGKSSKGTPCGVTAKSRCAVIRTR